MKKRRIVMGIVSAVLMIPLIFGLASCLNRQKYTLNIPVSDSVFKITLEQNDNTVTVEDTEQIKDIVEVIGAVKRTTHDMSINDVPINAENTIRLHFHFDTESITTIFVYQKGSDYYIEQPYNGIYQISSDEFNSVEKYLK